MLKHCSINQFSFDFSFDVHAFEGLRCFSSRIPYLFPTLQLFCIGDHCFDAFSFLKTHLSSEITWKQSKVMLMWLWIRRRGDRSQFERFLGDKRCFCTLVFTASLRSFSSFLEGSLVFFNIVFVFSFLSRGILIPPSLFLPFLWK